jgi:hypothetical protein
MSEDQTFDPVEVRRSEVAQYDANIAMYHTILTGLPQEWPDELVEHRNPKDPHTAIDRVPEDKVEQVAQLWYVDQLKHLIRTETVERTKAAAILAAFEAGA